MRTNLSLGPQSCLERAGPRSGPAPNETRRSERCLSPLDEARAWTTIGQLPPSDFEDPKPEASLRKAIAAKPDYALAHYLLAEVLEIFEPEKSAEHKKKALELRPDWGRGFPEPALDEGPPSGLLLAFCDSRDAAACRSLFLAPEKGRWDIQARGPGVLVPRRDGFWHVGIRPPEDEAHWFDWMLWAAPTRAEFTVPTVQGAVEGITDGERSLSLSFVGPNLVAVEQYFESYQPSLQYNHRVHVFALDNVTETFASDQSNYGLTISEVLGESAAEALALTVEHEARSGESKASMRFSPGVHADWTIRRGRGRFKVTGRVSSGFGAARGDYIDFDIPVPLPASITGVDTLPLHWEQIQEAIPGAGDAFGSPGGSVLVVRTCMSRNGTFAERILVYAVRQGGLGPLLFATGPSEDSGQIVLAQWSTGKNVARWTRELRTLQQN